MSKYYYISLIQAKNAFDKNARNAWNLITKFDFIQNLCTQSHYTKVYRFSMRLHHFQYKIYYFMIFQMPLNEPIQEEMAKKGRF